jgi:hypothetical protein
MTRQDDKEIRGQGDKGRRAEIWPIGDMFTRLPQSPGGMHENREKHGIPSLHDLHIFHVFCTAYKRFTAIWCGGCGLRE